MKDHQPKLQLELVREQTFKVAILQDPHHDKDPVGHHVRGLGYVVLELEMDRENGFTETWRYKTSQG